MDVSAHRAMRGQRSLDAFLLKEPLKPKSGGAGEEGDSDTDFQDTPPRVRAAIKAAVKPAAKSKAKAKAKASPKQKATKRRKAIAPAPALAPTAGTARPAALPPPQLVAGLSTDVCGNFTSSCNSEGGAVAASAGIETIIISDSESGCSD